MTILPARFEFTRSATRFDIITGGPFAFKRGYQIKFTGLTGETEDLRGSIANLSKLLLEQYTQLGSREASNLLRININRVNATPQTFSSPDFVAP